MTLRDTIFPVTRNNWDYGWNALVGATSRVHDRVSQAPNVTSLFQQDPIWTNAGRTSRYAFPEHRSCPAAPKWAFHCPAVRLCSMPSVGLALEPRFINSNNEDYGLFVADLHKKHANVAAVVPAHVFDSLADVDAINAAANGSPVIEDRAQSVPSTCKEDTRDRCPRFPSSHSVHRTTYVIRLPSLRPVHGPKMRATQRRDD